MTSKSINTTLDIELYSKIKILALKVSAEKETKVYTNKKINKGWFYEKAFSMSTRLF